MTIRNKVTFSFLHPRNRPPKVLYDWHTLALTEQVHIVPSPKVKSPKKYFLYSTSPPLKSWIFFLQSWFKGFFVNCNLLLNVQYENKCWLLIFNITSAHPFCPEEEQWRHLTCHLWPLYIMLPAVGRCGRGAADDELPGSTCFTPQFDQVCKHEDKDFFFTDK